MTRRIAVFTGTRAEYGLLYWLMRDLRDAPNCVLQVIVSGMHLSPEFGSTWTEVEADGFSIDAKVEMLLSSDSAVGVAKAMGLGTIGFADALDRLAPDMLVILGDRFEALAIAQAALVLRIPIAHIHGGEVTEGAYDNAIRHAITKMAALHFVATADYARRVRQMGEDPARIHHVGAVGLDHFQRGTTIGLEMLASQLNFPLRQPYFLVTYHPATLGDERPEDAVQTLLDALDHFPNHQVLITYPNADDGGRRIIERLEAYAAENSERVLARASLGFVRYKAALRGAAAVIGNSSSGIIEAPSVGVPTVDIGARQRGRLAADSVIHCAPNTADIVDAIASAISPQFRERARQVVNPYGSGNASARIAEVLLKESGPFSQAFFETQSP